MTSFECLEIDILFLLFRDDGVMVPCGKIVDASSSLPQSPSLQYNEFIVYDTRQIKLRYLVQLKFKYKY